MINIKSGSDFLGKTLDSLAEAILQLAKDNATCDTSKQLFPVLVYLENVYLQVQDFIKKNEQPVKKKALPAPKKPVANPFAKKPVKAPAKPVAKVAPKVVKKVEVKNVVAKPAVKKPAPKPVVKKVAAPVAKKPVIAAKKAPVVTNVKLPKNFGKVK